MREAIIKDYPNYKIREDGVIFSRFITGGNGSISEDSWKELKQIHDKSCGYMIVTLCSGTGRRQNKRVHRLLMESFVPNPNNFPHINHIDGNKLNNSLSNLEWCTCKHNAQHAIATGLCDARIAAREVKIIQMDKEFNFIREHKSIHQAGRDTGIAWQNISKVLRGLRQTAGGFRWCYKESSETIPLRE